MTDIDINPFGTGGTLPEGYPISNSLDENNAQKALSAAMGYRLARMSGGKHWQGKTWYAYGASLTEFGMYTTPLAAMSGMTCVNKGIGGEGIHTTNHLVRDAIMNNTDGKAAADLITVEVLGNEPWATFGEVTDGLNTDGTTPADAFDTYLGCLVQCILYLQKNTNAQIVIFPFTDSRYQYGHPEDPLTPNRLLQCGKYLHELRAMIQTVCNMYGVYYFDPNNALGWAKKTNDYISDQVHYTALGGYVVAEYLWSKIKDIPLWRTAVPA